MISLILSRCSPKARVITMRVLVTAFILFVVSCGLAHAQQVGTQGTIYDAMKNTFGRYDPSSPDGMSSLTRITSYAQGWAQKIFLIMAATEMAWFFANWAMAGGRLEDGTVKLGQQLLPLLVFSFIASTSADWWPHIYTTFAGIGNDLASKIGCPGSGGPCYVPGTISVASYAQSGIDLAWDLMNPGGQSGFWGILSAFTTSITSLTAPIVLAIVAVYAVLAAQLALVQIQFFIYSYGVVLLGFLGLNSTRPIGQGVIHLGITLGVRLLAITGYAGVMALWARHLQQDLGLIYSATWAGQMAGLPLGPVGSFLTGLGNSFGSSMPLYLEAFVGTLVLGVVGFQIPKMAEAWLTGTPTTSLGDFVKAAASGAALAAAPVAIGAAAAMPLAAPALAGGAAASASGIASGMNAIGGAASAAGAAGGAASAGGGAAMSGFTKAAMGAQMIANVVDRSKSSLDDISQHFGHAGGSAQLRM